MMTTTNNANAHANAKWRHCWVCAAAPVARERHEWPDWAFFAAALPAVNHTGALSGGGGDYPARGEPTMRVQGLNGAAAAATSSGGTPRGWRHFPAWRGRGQPRDILHRRSAHHRLARRAIGPAVYRGPDRAPQARGQEWTAGTRRPGCAEIERFGRDARSVGGRAPEIGCRGAQGRLRAILGSMRFWGRSSFGSRSSSPRPPGTKFGVPFRIKPLQTRHNPAFTRLQILLRVSAACI